MEKLILTYLDVMALAFHTLITRLEPESHKPEIIVRNADGGKVNTVDSEAA